MISFIHNKEKESHKDQILKKFRGWLFAEPSWSVAPIQKSLAFGIGLFAFILFESYFVYLLIIYLMLFARSIPAFRASTS